MFAFVFTTQFVQFSKSLNVICQMLYGDSFMQTTIISKPLLAMGLALLMAIESPIYAQRDATAKAMGIFGGSPSMNSTSRNLHTARGYASGVYHYPAPVIQAQPSMPRNDAVIIGHALSGAQQNLAITKKELANDKDALARIDALEKHLQAAVEKHKLLHAECMKPTADGQMTASCCNDLIRDLDKAIAEHDALVRKISPPTEGTVPHHPAK